MYDKWIIETLNQVYAILVVGPSWVGDMVMAHPLFKILKDRFPNAAIDCLAPSWSQPLIERMPEIRQGIDLPLRHGQLGLGIRHSLGRALRGCYQRAIVLPNSFKSALIPFFARIPRRTGFIGEARWGLLNDARRLKRRALPRTTERFAALGLERGEALPDPLPLPHLEHLPHRVCATFRGLGLPLDGRPNIAFCPGAEYGPAKRWPVHHFKTLASHCSHEGWRVLVLGSGKEQSLGAEIAAAAGTNGCNLAGATSLGEAVDLLSFVQAVVTNDSGLMHIAAALNRPLVAIFGSSDPHHTPPLSPQAHILTGNHPCAPCFKRHCPLEEPAPCLEEITPQMVIDSLKTILS
ncbi:MAG: lipopolysaccharide heptosyltransferase II [Magnetococcales bacterium]|nr:lipopolysaccharide heptosyltransferase II [Magnetococcales bacterium]